MIVVTLILVTLCRVVSSVIDLPSVNACDIGDVIQNGRVTCSCAENYVYECELKNFTASSDNLHSPGELGVNTTFDLVCQPGKAYTQETTTCICDKNGKWPHSACGDLFASLPPSSVEKSKCEPNGFIFIGCNVCKCTSEGTIDKGRCTRNDCGDLSPQRRKSSKANSVYGNCEAKNWYSLAPCQFCFCINENKLVCNTGNYFHQSLQLGSYNLSVCGKDLIREAIELIPDEDKSLRHGGKTETTTTVPTTVTTTIATTSSTVESGESEDIIIQLRPDSQASEEPPHRIDVNVNDEKIEVGRVNEQEDEDYTETEDDDLNNMVANEKQAVPSTQLPYEEDYQIYNKEEESTEKYQIDNSERLDEVSNAGNDQDVASNLRIPVSSAAFQASLPKSPLRNNKLSHPLIPVQDVTETDYKDLGPIQKLGLSLSQQLPIVLSKVFNITLRRNTLTLDKNGNCVPGSMKVDKCNTCYCLKNSKMLCTNKKCK